MGGGGREEASRVPAKVLKLEAGTGRRPLGLGSHSTRGDRRADRETSRELRRLRKWFDLGRGLCLFS